MDDSVYKKIAKKISNYKWNKSNRLNDFLDYRSVQDKNFSNFVKTNEFSILVPLVTNLYDISFTAIPDNKGPGFGELLLFCHKSLLSAVSLIAQAQPEDSIPITRRAIEAAMLGFQMAVDPESIDSQWTKLDDRKRFWESHNSSIEPKRKVHIDRLLPKEHPLYKLHGSKYEYLKNQTSILSNTACHYTPELYISMGWDIMTRGERTKKKLNYFELSQKIIMQDLIFALLYHVKILELFDVCIGNAFSHQQQFLARKNEFYFEVKKLGQNYFESLKDI